MFRPCFDLRFNLGFLQKEVYVLPNGLYIFFPIRAADCNLVRELLVLIRLDISKSQIFQLPFDLPNPEPAC